MQQSIKIDWIWPQAKMKKVFVISPVVASTLASLKSVLSALLARWNPLSLAEAAAVCLPLFDCTPCLAFQTWDTVIWVFNCLQKKKYIHIYKQISLFFSYSREFSKPLLPVGRAGVLLAEILHLLCKQMVSVQEYHSYELEAAVCVYAWNHLLTFPTWRYLGMVQPVQIT